MNTPVTIDTQEHFTTITIDDGKVNVMSPGTLSALHNAFDAAARAGKSVILTGRPGIFSAGFDLNVIRGGSAIDRHLMIRLGAELALKILTFPYPVVAACTGHALPMGAFLMLASDLRLGADCDYSIGMNEVAIGLTVPEFAVELARSRLTPAYFSRSITTGQRFAPEEAMRAGYLDMIVPAEALKARAEETAVALTTGLHMPSHTASKLKARRPTIEAMRKAIDSELTLENFVASMAAEAGKAA